MRTENVLQLFKFATVGCVNTFMIPLHKGVFFFLHFPLKKIDWDYYPLNCPLFWSPLRFYTWIMVIHPLYLSFFLANGRNNPLIIVI